MAKSAITTYDDDVTGWKFTGVNDSTVGFYLKDISHDGHFFATSIRLERIAISGFIDGSATRSRDDLANHHVISLSDCTETQAPEIVEMSKKSHDPLGYYTPRLKAVAKYELTGVVYETDQKLELELAYLFTPYNKDPSHEPGAVIPAARIYPTLTFRFPGIVHKKKKSSYRAANAIQAFFRINIKLDQYPDGGNQIGLFRDIDDLGPLNQAIEAFASGGGAGSFFFNRAEKPLVYEIASWAVSDGMASYWDNIHQWSHPTPKKFDDEDYLAKALEHQIPTPGLPYGGHIHWRWSAGAKEGIIGLPGGDHFAGSQGAGSPLLDDAILHQDIHFAIVDLDGWFDPSREQDFLAKIDTAPPTYCFKPLDEIFKSLEGSPAIVWPTFDPLIWMSITVRGPTWDWGDPYKEIYPGSGISPKDFPDVEHTVEYYLQEWGGTMFAHGIFFPHEEMAYMNIWGKSGRFRRAILKYAPGIDKAQYVPADDEVKDEWERGTP